MATNMFVLLLRATGMGLSQGLFQDPTPAPSAAAAPASAVPASADSASALPSWLLVALLSLVALIVAAMFVLTFYNLSAPRSTLKNVLGLKRRARQGMLVGGAPLNVASNPQVSQQVIEALSLAARVGKRTTRTTLAITGFSLLGVIIVAMFGVKGEGVRDLRSQVVAAVTTLVATIAGFYFGSEKAGNNTPPPSGSVGVAPLLLADPNPGNSQFKVGVPGAYTPRVSGTAPLTVSASPDLPDGLQLDSSTGAISGTPTTAGEYVGTLGAHNAYPPDATLDVKITITE